MMVRTDTAHRVEPRHLALVVSKAIGYLATARNLGWILGQSRPFNWETDLPAGERRSWPAVHGKGRGRVFDPSKIERKTV